MARIKRSLQGAFALATACAVISIASCKGGRHEAASALATTRVIGLTAAVCDATAPGVSAHPVHGADNLAHAGVGCAECHAIAPGICAIGQSAPSGNVVFGTLATLDGATPRYDPATRTCSGVYCHGATLAAPPAPPTWRSVTIDPSRPLSQACSTCHGYPPASPHPQFTGCQGCHPTTVRADGSINLSGGHHIDGKVDAAAGSGGGCDGCHGFPPATGAHAKHLGREAGTSGYGDTAALQDRFPSATPTTAPAVYGFGCGSCHPLDPARHFDGTVEVELYDATAPAGSLKARAAPGAAYDAATGTCSGTYCHSSGQASPAFVASPGWRSGTALGCDGCHANPPRYPSGGAGATDANSHVGLADDGYEFGHFLGMPGPWHSPKHGGFFAGDDAAPITCQTCHYETTHPANTGPSGFYYLDTTGTYQLPGGDPSRLGSPWYANYDCSSCHRAGQAPTGRGMVLPLRHVNGVRDVAFDPRTALPDIAWLPPAPDRPTMPYWETNAGGWAPWPPSVVWNGGTVSFGLTSARYDRGTKSCSGVACHLAATPVWGRPYDYLTTASTCYTCHPNL
jgi:predicted CxxxxCH...CXXCH cytochrome family protein